MKVVSATNLPFRLPIQFTVLALLAIDVWKLSEGPCWILYGMIGLAWICWLFSAFKEEAIDIFKDKS